MKVTIKKITVENPAAYQMNQYRQAAVNHINLALETLTANLDVHPAVFATLNQLYEDLQGLQMIGIINSREYDATAAIAFDVLCGDNARLSLPDIDNVRYTEGDEVYTIQECRKLVRAAIAAPLNKCLLFLATADSEDWKADGWESQEEYVQFVCKSAHNLMRLGKIIGATTDKDHDFISSVLKRCAENKIAEEVNFDA